MSKAKNSKGWGTSIAERGEVYPHWTERQLYVRQRLTEATQAEVSGPTGNRKAEVDVDLRLRMAN